MKQKKIHRLVLDELTGSCELVSKTSSTARYEIIILWFMALIFPGSSLWLQVKKDAGNIINMLRFFDVMRHLIVIYVSIFCSCTQYVLYLR